ncbi:uncharacterized protein LOC120270392 [Dioscorea cayenensis subsp. rotundata]|uniref:Uncharacterized protein LOC120270392 n=1 Tax=Dioscorea cayennensis subsp. rotundata TaxID=55577 RepID=A0AB40C2D1_DIOCR|nr:uncharacterized protein LOC120270392 [Dioscorea cayenensis subsp. rotundata]
MRVSKAKMISVTAIKHYCLLKSVEYKVIESDPTRYSGKCKSYGDGCNWRVHASYSKRRQLWEITKYTGPHTCSSAMISQDHSKLDSNMICHQIQALVQQQPSINVSVLIAEIKNRYGYTPPYRKVWTTKQKVVEVAFGNWEESYNELPRWLSALQQFVPGTIVDLETQLAYNGPYLVRDARIFHRVFWSFPACVEAFKYCKPVIQIDGTHIYGKYKGTLLLAIAQDGNKNILPIGFAIVEGETLGGWTFFLRNLRSSVTPQQGICFISDRHESIKSAFRSLGREMSAPHAYHVYCIRHISANFMRRFRNKEMQRIVVNIGKLQD